MLGAPRQKKKKKVILASVIAQPTDPSLYLHKRSVTLEVTLFMQRSEVTRGLFTQEVSTHFDNLLTTFRE